MPIAKPVFVLPLAAVLFLTACTETGPRQNTGTAAGAVAGGILGGIITGRPAGAAVGAGIGAIAGGAIGQQLDIQAGELRAGFDDGRISVVNTGTSLVVTMPEAILFATDSAELTASIRKNLRVLATFLVDGMVAGTWKLERKRAAATVTLTPFVTLRRAVRAALTDEGERLARFVEPDATHHAVVI